MAQWAGFSMMYAFVVPVTLGSFVSPNDRVTAFLEASANNRSYQCESPPDLHPFPREASGRVLGPEGLRGGAPLATPAAQQKADSAPGPTLCCSSGSLSADSTALNLSSGVTSIFLLTGQNQTFASKEKPIIQGCKYKSVLSHTSHRQWPEPSPQSV